MNVAPAPLSPNRSKRKNSLLTNFFLLLLKMQIFEYIEYLLSMSEHQRQGNDISMKGLGKKYHLNTIYLTASINIGGIENKYSIP